MGAVIRKGGESVAETALEVIELELDTTGARLFATVFDSIWKAILCGI